MATSSRVSQALFAAAKNGRPLPSGATMDATKFILAYPRGAYTAARTVDQTKIFDYAGHLKRLVDSTLAMHEKTIHVSKSDIESIVRSRTEDTLRAAMMAFKQQYGSLPDEEYKITVLVTVDEPMDDLEHSMNVYCHIGLLPPLRSGLVKLQVAGMPRANASAKDSAWVRDRKAIYDTMPKDIEEIILMEPETQQLLEGSQTNFYAIHKDGTIVTADEGILKGTVRGLVLDVCAEQKIPVTLTPPSLREIDQWDGCFISSTSRLVLGAKRLEYVDPASHRSVIKTFDSTPLLEKIIALVRSSVDHKSTQVF